MPHGLPLEAKRKHERVKEVGISQSPDPATEECSGAQCGLTHSPLPMPSTLLIVVKYSSAAQIDSRKVTHQKLSGTATTHNSLLQKHYEFRELRGCNR